MTATNTHPHNLCTLLNCVCVCVFLNDYLTPYLIDVCVVCALVMCLSVFLFLSLLLLHCINFIVRINTWVCVWECVCACVLMVATTTRHLSIFRLNQMTVGLVWSQSAFLSFFFFFFFVVPLHPATQEEFYQECSPYEYTVKLIWFSLLLFLDDAISAQLTMHVTTAHTVG